MTEASAESAPTEAPAEVESETQTAEQGKPAEDVLGDAGKQAIDRMKAERDDAARQAKALKRELEQVRQKSLSDAERAVLEAEQRGRASATTEFGKRLAKTQFDALAGRRNADFDIASALEYVDLSKFLDEDGEPNTKAITAAVERLVPAPQAGPPSFDGGARSGSQKAPSMDSLIRQQAGRSR